MFGPSSSEKEAQARAGSIQDVEAYFKQIRNVIKRYKKLVLDLDEIKKDKKKVEKRMELIVSQKKVGISVDTPIMNNLSQFQSLTFLYYNTPSTQTERGKIKDEFIAKKQAARANIALLKEGLNVLKEKELKDIQEEYREVDAEFRALGVMVEKDALMDGRPNQANRNNEFDPTRAKNDDLLDKAKNTQEDTLMKLKSGLATVEATKEQGKFTAAQLEQDREKMKRIDSGLDNVQSEMELSQVLITRFVKRVASDKVIIAFATLLVLAILGIVIYAALNPNQSIFNVPSVVVPPIVTSTATPSVLPTPKRRLLIEIVDSFQSSVFSTPSSGNALERVENVIKKAVEATVAPLLRGGSIHDVTVKNSLRAGPSTDSFAR